MLTISEVQALESCSTDFVILGDRASAAGLLKKVVIPLMSSNKPARETINPPANSGLTERRGELF